MGDPIECEHVNPENGDSLQHTTTGLSFYRKATNTPTFTNGGEHWAITGDGLTYWTGTTIDPPGVVATVAAPAPPAPAPQAAAPAPSPTPALTEADIAARVGPSIVQVITDTGEGSGVRIADGILTNAHVVADSRQVEVATSDRRRARATILRIDNNADLALLQTDLAVPPLDTEFMGQQRQGDAVLVMGYPLFLREGGGQAILTRGLISGTQKEANGQALIQTDAAINPGNSGGAMVNMRGKLIGVSSYTFVKFGAQGVHFAIAMDTVNAFLGMPQSAVTWFPPAPIFRGDPRDLMLGVSDFRGGGGSWVLDSEDNSGLSNGLDGRVFSVLPDHDPMVVVVVAVTPTLKEAQDRWATVAKPLDASYSTYSVPSIGEATYSAISSAKRTLIISTRTKNVLLSVVVISSVYLSDVDAAEGSLRTMINRVNANLR